jgi:hypothetical protein
MKKRSRSQRGTAAAAVGEGGKGEKENGKMVKGKEEDEQQQFVKKENKWRKREEHVLEK